VQARADYERRGMKMMKLRTLGEFQKRIMVDEEDEDDEKNGEEDDYEESELEKLLIH
jgi:hypothetical protein